MESNEGGLVSRQIESDTLAVIGAGAWGTTLAAIQADNFRRVWMYTKDTWVPEEVARFHSNERYQEDLRLGANVFATASLQRAVLGASMALVVLPSFASREVAHTMSGLIEPGVPLVLATKGMERGSGLLSIEVWRQELGLARRQGRRDPLVLSGPNLAGEIARGLPSVSVLAGTDPASVRRAARRLSHPLLNLVEWLEPVGVQVVGALKNVYAVACGMAKGLNWGDNVTAALVWRGLDETGRLVEALGGDPAVIPTPAGIGDFLATCTSPSSRNYSLGMKLVLKDARGGARGVAEGATTAAEAVRRARGVGLELSLLEAVRDVMAGDAEPEHLLEALFRDRAKHRKVPDPGLGRGLTPVPVGATTGA